MRLFFDFLPFDRINVIDSLSNASANCVPKHDTKSPIRPHDADKTVSVKFMSLDRTSRKLRIFVKCGVITDKSTKVKAKNLYLNKNTQRSLHLLYLPIPLLFPFIPCNIPV